MLIWTEEHYQLRRLLPDTFSELEATVDILPLAEAPILYPFAGFVINFNITTLVHRDWKDKEVCIVFQFSSDDLQGGELCLVEPGISIRMRNGDGVIFRSSQISHFNTDFVGKRMSMVFHSDRELECWRKDRNGWLNCVHLKSFDNTDHNPTM